MASAALCKAHVLITDYIKQIHCHDSNKRESGARREVCGLCCAHCPARHIEANGNFQSGCGLSLGRYRCCCTRDVCKCTSPAFTCTCSLMRDHPGLNNMYMRCVRCADNLTVYNACISSLVPLAFCHTHCSGKEIPSAIDVPSLH